MRSLSPPSLHDAVRLLGPTVEETVPLLVEHYQRKLPIWSYEVVRRAAAPLLSHSTTLSSVQSGISRVKSEVGRVSNSEVARLVWQAGENRHIQCYDLPPRYFKIRHDLSLRLPIDFYLVENRRPIAFWLQPRKGFLLTDFERQLLASIIRFDLEVEWEDFDVEVLELGPLEPKGVRLPRTFRFDEASRVDPAELMATMERFAEAFDIVNAMNIDRADRRRSRDNSLPNNPELDL